MCRWKDECRKRIYKKMKWPVGVLRWWDSSRYSLAFSFGSFGVWPGGERGRRSALLASLPSATREGRAEHSASQLQSLGGTLSFLYHPCKSQQSCSSRPLISSDFLDPTMCLWQDSLWLKSMGESRLGRGPQPDHSGAKGVLCCAVELKEFSVLVWPWGGRTTGDEIVSPPSLLEANTIPIRASQTQDSGLSFSVSAPFGWRWSLSSPAFGICVLLCVIY